MSKFLVAGIVQRETIVKVNEIPVENIGVIHVPDSIFTSIGGDAYNEALALAWLGNHVDLLSMIGRTESKEIINLPGNEVTLISDFILTTLNTTPTAVVLYDNSRRQQIFEDIKDLEKKEYDAEIFRKRAEMSEMLIISDEDFCRPLLNIGRELDKTIAVNIKQLEGAELGHYEEFLQAADILYISDDGLEEDPFDFVKRIAHEYGTKIIILGQGAKGLILYDKQENMIAHYNTVRTHEIVNTVGAGNALLSCFLHFYNKTGDSVFSVKNALLFASYKIGFMGTSNGFMTEEQIIHWRNLIWKEKG